MPVFYIDVQRGQDFVKDEEGANFPTVAEASKSAMQSALELIGIQIRDGECIYDDTVILRDDEGNTVERYAFHRLLKNVICER